jgi:histidinol phosphatase-like enzyme (inositol monophosphatase family)
VDLDVLLRVAEGAVDAAGAVLRPAFRSGLAADTKVDDSPVTAADRGAEMAMRAVLRAACPEDGILGEEFGLERPDAPRRWVLDPLDGTRAFITGRPLFGILLALMEGDTPLLGIIDQPVLGERWVGVAGRKTRFTGPFGGHAGCRPCALLGQAELSATSPEMFGTELPRFQRLAGRVRRTVWGGDCYAYGLLALGQADVVVEADLKVWDWAAVLPVVEGAGGRMTDWQGNTLRRDGNGQVLAIGDPALLPQAIESLRP